MLIGALGAAADEIGAVRPEWPADTVSPSSEPPGMPPARRAAVIGELADIHEHAGTAEVMLQHAFASPRNRLQALRDEARSRSETVRLRGAVLADSLKPHRGQLLATECVATLLRIPMEFSVSETARVNLDEQRRRATVAEATVSAAIAIVLSVDNVASLAAAGRD